MNSAVSPQDLAKVGHWYGELSLRLGLSQARTAVIETERVGPYSIQKAHYPEVDESTCHILLLHPPGGLVAGDALRLNVQCEKLTQCFITNPSAGKIYCCKHLPARQRQTLRLQEGAALEWFPHELILFEGSVSELETAIDLKADALFAGWEILCLGRDPKCTSDAEIDVRQSIVVSRDGRRVFVDRIRLESASAELLGSAWGLNGASVFGTMIMTGASDSQLEIGRECLAGSSHCELGITLIDDILVCRGLASQSRHLKRAFYEFWQKIRPQIMGKPAFYPRIWNT